MSEQPPEVWVKEGSMGAEENHLETVATLQGNSGFFNWNDGNWQLLLGIGYYIFLGFLSRFIKVSLCDGWGFSNISTTKLVLCHRLD